MPKVIVTAEITDPKKWEEGFRSRSELFKSQTVTKPIHFTIVDGKRVVICFEPENAATWRKVLDSPATAQAMKEDAVKRETVQFYVLDKECKP